MHACNAFWRVHVARSLVVSMPSPLGGAKTGQRVRHAQQRACLVGGMHADEVLVWVPARGDAFPIGWGP